jgi:hypothetical protein
MYLWDECRVLMRAVPGVMLMPAVLYSTGQYVRLAAGPFIAACFILTIGAILIKFIIGRITYSPVAQLVERMTVNHHVTGSSPVGGGR